MKRVLFLVLLMLLSSKAFCFEVVYPTEKKIATNSEYAFFVGKTNGFESLSINGTGVFSASNGAFGHSVNLKEGENRVVLRTAFGMQIYTFYKKTPVYQELATESFKPILAYVKENNTPLRSTPVDAGLNRIGHLFKNTRLVLNGSQGSFYRVVLSKDKTAWIAKNDVCVTDKSETPAEFIGMDSERFKNAVIQTITFSKTLPYSIEDNDNEIIFRVYNPEISDESVYNINVPKPEKYAYTITEYNGKYTLKVRELSENIKNLTVVIDAGHGGAEKGAIGCLGDEEKDINLKIAQKVHDYLSKKGVNVKMTRDLDCNLSLQDRVDISKENNADIFVSIHLNSIGGNTKMDVHKTRGTSVYFFNNNSKKLAESILKSVNSKAKTHNDGVRTASFAVIRPADYAAVLVEAAYMTNPLDSCLYRNDKFLDKVAKGISDGVINFIKK